MVALETSREGLEAISRNSEGLVVKTDDQKANRESQEVIEAGPQPGTAAESFSLFPTVPFTPSQGVCGTGAEAMSSTMFSPFSSFQRPGVDTAGLGLINSDGSSGSDTSAQAMPGSPLAAAGMGYSPFTGAPWGNSLYAASDPPGPPPLELPNSPMSPGLVFNPSPAGTLPTPTSPRSMFSAQAGAFGSLNAGLRTPSGSLHLPSGFNSSAANAAAAAAAADATAAAAFSGLPQFYYNAAAAAAAAAAAGGPNQLQAALNQTLLNQHTATLAAAAQHQQQHQQQLLQAALSATLANQAAAAHPLFQGYNANLLPAALEPMRSAGGSLSLDGGLQQQASVHAAAAFLQQQQQQQLVAAMAAQHQQASQLRRNMSTPAGVAAQLGLGSASCGGGLGGLGASSLTSSGSGLLGGGVMGGRLQVTHSADLTHLDAAALLGGAGGPGSMSARPKFNKSRKNSEPKIGPDGQPRLNARQRRTLRRAKERALKGLLEVSQALLQKAEVQVTVPNISHLTALEELAAVEAEKEAASAAAGGGGAGRDSETGEGGCLSPSSAAARGSSSGGGAGSSSSRGSQAAGAQKVPRSQQLAAAAAAVEESVCEIARAAVAAVTAQATGKDTSSAAAAAQAAAANAANAAASAGAVLPPGFVMPEVDEGASEELQGCNSDLLDCLAQSAPTSPVGSALTPDPSSGRSSSSSSGSLPGSARCSSSSSTGSVVSAYVASGGKPPMCQPPRPASTTATGPGSSPLCSPLPSPTPSCGPAAALTPPAKAACQLEGIDIAGLIGQLSLKKDEGMVDDKLIRDLQIIQSLIGALKAPGAAAAGLDGSSGGGSSSCGGPSSGASPVPARHMRGVGARSMPKQRCNSPCTGIPLHSL